MDAMQRFWAKVDVRGRDECWPWTAHLSQSGYGRFGPGGRVEPVTAPRWLLGQLRGDPLHWVEGDRECACHTCDNRACVNPRHLYVGTLSTNNQDTHDRQRRSYESRHKVRCDQGHPLEGDNLYINPQGWRSCRTCANESAARYRARARERRL